ncbi:MAG: GNAT family N-acetyltransferase [Myxococcota bacterium]|nr:GNAT family N-acetyltransferase [Myxococcota bacterium]
MARRDDGGDGGDGASTCARELDRRHVGLSLAIRECKPDDASKLEWMGLLRAQRASIDDAYARHTSGEEVLLVAESQGFPIALARLDLHEEIAVVLALRVMPGLQGLGIGTALLASAERILRERGRAIAQISVDRDDLKGVARYVRLGYVAIECDDTGHIVLQKSLDPSTARRLHPIAR